MGGNIIGALIFIVISLAIITKVSQFERHNMQRNNLQSAVILEAKELKTFSNAAFEYSESFNVPLSTTSLTVSNLQAYGLLSSTFPQTTPFGQKFQATYATDTCNSDVMDLFVKTSGVYNINLLAKYGLNKTLGVNYINSEVNKTLSSLGVSYQNASNPCVTNGQPDYIGFTTSGSSSLNLYGGGTISTNVTSSNADSAIYIYAPNQWGYLVFSFEFGFMPDWDAINGNTASINGTITSQPGVINISGWNSQCPTGGNIISAGNTYTNTYTPSNGSSIFFRKLFCIPAYKSQVNSIVGTYADTKQVFNYPLGSPVYFGNYYISGTNSSNAYMENSMTGSTIFNSSTEYINSGNIIGLNNNIYGVQNYFQSYPLYTIIPNGSYPGDNFIPVAPLYNVFAPNGIDIIVNGVTYQIATWDYDFITGYGVTPTAAGMNNPNIYGQSFPSGSTIWQDSNGMNQGSSYNNYGGGYYITSNPSNPNNFDGSINYYPSNDSTTTDSISFYIPTPLIN
ncbi:MAG: hypothetical protein M1385_00115 [Candidatus Marsarchaeota archaeon]|jgi:hypothetical protein|nr:hypothetical protein [Candidatus Marsarchaeota archaeon]